MLRFASALPALRDAAQQDLRRRGLKRDRVAAGVVRLIDLGLFRIGGERYAELDHHYGVTTLEKRHVRLTRDGILFDYIAKCGQGADDLPSRTGWSSPPSGPSPTATTATRRCSATSTTTAGTGSTPARSATTSPRGPGATSRPRNSGPGMPPCSWRWCWRTRGHRRPRRSRQRVIAASVREVARALGDTPAVARSSYIDPRLINRYQSEGQLPGIPVAPAVLPASAGTETAIAALLASCGDGLAPGASGRSPTESR